MRNREEDVFKCGSVKSVVINHGTCIQQHPNLEIGSSSRLSNKFQHSCMPQFVFWLGVKSHQSILGKVVIFAPKNEYLFGNYSSGKNCKYLSEAILQ